MAEPSSLSGTTRGQYLQGEEEENPGCLVSSAAHIQLWGCCPSPLLPGGCRDKSKGKAKTSGHPGSRLSGELVQRAGLAQKTCNWPSWAITCCKRRQRDSFDTTVKITLLEKKKINTNTTERESETKTINSWDKELKVSVGGQPDLYWKTKLYFFCWQITFYAKGQRSHEDAGLHVQLKEQSLTKDRAGKNSHGSFCTSPLSSTLVSIFVHWKTKDFCNFVLFLACHTNVLQDFCCFCCDKGRGRAEEAAAIQHKCSWH